MITELKMDIFSADNLEEDRYADIQMKINDLECYILNHYSDDIEEWLSRHRAGVPYHYRLEIKFERV